MSEPGQRLGSFELLNADAGTATPWGPIYRAQHALTGQTAVVLILDPQRAGEDDFAQRFLQQAGTVRQVAHPNLEAVLDAGESSGVYYLATEWIEGRSVADWLHSDGPLPEQTALEITRCTAQALKAAWNAAQLTHGGVTAESLWVMDDGLVKLRGMTPVKSEEGSRLGDMRALGGALYQMLTAVPMTQTGPCAPDLMEKRPGLGRFVGDVLDKMLIPLPAHNYASYDDLVEDLNALLGQREPPFASPQLSVGSLSSNTPAAPQHGAIRSVPLPGTPGSVKQQRASGFDWRLLAKPALAVLFVVIAWLLVEWFGRNQSPPPSTPPSASSAAPASRR